MKLDVLLPSDTHRKPITYITAALLAFVTYLLTLPPTINSPFFSLPYSFLVVPVIERLITPSLTNNRQNESIKNSFVYAVTHFACAHQDIIKTERISIKY
jgi:hypothetical protein